MGPADDPGPPPASPVREPPWRARASLVQDFYQDAAARSHGLAHQPVIFRSGRSSRRKNAYRRGLLNIGITDFAEQEEPDGRSDAFRPLLSPSVIPRRRIRKRRKRRRKKDPRHSRRDDVRQQEGTRRPRTIGERRKVGLGRTQMSPSPFAHVLARIGQIAIPPALLSSL